MRPPARAWPASTPASTTVLPWFYPVFPGYQQSPNYNPYYCETSNQELQREHSPLYELDFPGGGGDLVFPCGVPLDKAREVYQIHSICEFLQHGPLRSEV